MNAANLIQVYSAGDSIEAYALSSRLEDVGVRAMVVGEHLQGGLGALPFGRSTAPRLCVAAEDAQRAEEIVAAWESERQRPRANRNSLPFQFGLSAVLINMTLLAILFALYRPLGSELWLGVFVAAVGQIVFGNILVLAYRRKQAKPCADDEAPEALNTS